MTILLVLGILVFLIVAHELGHFIVAKLSGVRVEEFGVGYPPRAFSLGVWGGTEYTLNWIPFGGFVRLYGDEGQGIHGAHTLADATRFRKALILLAGVTMNALVAWGVFAYAYTLGVPRAVTEPGTGVELVLSQVLPGSPAALSGLATGDTIVSVQDEKKNAVTPLTPEKVTEFVRSHGGKLLTITYLHEGATSTAQVSPAHAVLTETKSTPAIGVGMVLVSAEPLPLGEALVSGAHRTWYEAGAIFSQLKILFAKFSQGDNGLSNIVGPVGLIGVVGDASTHGIGYLLGLIGVISVNLAVINLIPIPALDGGRLALLGLEAIIRRPVPRGFVSLLNATGVLIMIALMITVTYQDIARLLA